MNLVCCINSLQFVLQLVIHQVELELQAELVKIIDRTLLVANLYELVQIYRLVVINLRCYIIIIVRPAEFNSLCTTIVNCTVIPEVSIKFL